MQAEGKRWIVNATIAASGRDKLSFDLPNIHLLHEYLQRSIPILGNGHFSRTGPFEAHHQQVKRVLRDFRVQGVRQFEESTFREILHQQMLRFVLQGGRWGDSLQYRAGEELLGFKHYKEGREQEPHPALEPYLLHPKPLQQKTAVYPDEWRPSHADTSEHTGEGPSSSAAAERRTKLPTSTRSVEFVLEQRVKLQKSLDHFFPHLAISLQREELELVWVHGFNKWHPFHQVSLRNEDDISALVNGTVRFLRIHKCVVVKKGDIHVPLIYPLWYEEQLPRFHPNVPLVKKRSDREMSVFPIPPSVFIEQVLILHNCLRKCACSRQPCVCLLCSQKQLCVKHQLSPCARCTHLQPAVDYHQYSNNSYLVMDSSLGFEQDA